MTTLFVIGAAGGIGSELVRRALARGETVFAGVLTPEEGRRFDSHPQLRLVVVDVADSASVTAAFSEVDRQLHGARLDAVVNAAAIAPPGVLELTAIEDFQRIMNINATGSFRILQAALPRLRGHGGRLLLITSLWGKASGALVGTYAASKHAVEALADAARRETLGMNLHIVVIEPGVVQTPMYAHQAPDASAALQRMNSAERGLYGALYARYGKLVAGAARSATSPERAAAIIERALTATRPKPRYRIGADSKLVGLLGWLLPDRGMDAVMGASLNNKPLDSKH